MDNKNNIEAFDDLFKQGLEQASVPAPPSVWSGVQTAAQGTSSAGTSWMAKLAGLKGAAIITGAAVTVAALVYFTNPSEQAEKTEPTTEGVVEQTTPEDQAFVQSERSEQTTSDEAYSNHITEEINTELTEEKQPTKEPSVAQDGAETFQSDDNLQRQPNVVADGVVADEADALSIRLSATTVCQNQVLNAFVQPAHTVDGKKVVWRLDGKALRNETPGVEIYCSEVGKHTLSVAVLEGNKILAQDATDFNVNGHSAGFNWQMVEGGFELQSEHATAQNKWYINQLLEDENRQQVFVAADPGQTLKVVHVATSLQGCGDTVEQDITMDATCRTELDVPNVFTPYTQDGNNDEFTVRISPVDEFNMTIYNSNNVVVFETDNPDSAWHGKLQNQGALLPGGWYTCVIRYGCNQNVKTKTSRLLLVE